MWKKRFRKNLIFPGESKPSGRLSAGIIRRAGTRLVLILAAAMLIFSACAETADDNLIFTCKQKLDEALNAAGWDAAIAACEAAGGQEGISRAAQAYMGRAGVSLLDLLDGLSTSSLTGLPLILDLFSLTVGSAEYADTETAVNLLVSLACMEAETCNDTDYFNLTIASDVLLNSLFVDHMGLYICNQEIIDEGLTPSCTIDELDTLVVPGITDAGIDTLDLGSGTIDPNGTAINQVLTVFINIYTTANSYYVTTPLVWDDATKNADLKRLSGFVAANKLGADGLGLSTDPALESLSALDFSSGIDNGLCGYESAVDITAPGVSLPDPVTVAQSFPRRHNTSRLEYLIDEMFYTMLGLSGASLSTDDTKEWAGDFAIPSALLNPDFFQVNCGGTTTTSEFSVCMAAGTTVLSGYAHNLFIAPSATMNKTLTRYPGDTNPLCDDGAGNPIDCNFWPLLQIVGSNLSDGDNIGTDESIVPTNGPDATKELSQVLDAVYPIDNAVNIAATITGTHPAYACVQGDGLVHYREYDSYLRNFGQ